MNKKLAIKGHPTRGKEVIEILEMLGGVNGKINRKTSEIYNIYNGDYFIHEICDTREVAYYIDFESQIRRIDIKDITTYFIVYSLEGFLEEHPYKIGDKVNYVKYNDKYPSVYTIQGMRWIGATIEYVLDSHGFSALAKDLQPYKEESVNDKGNISDGYHTFNELYEYRLLYNASMFNELAKQGLYDVHKSRHHSDGSVPFDDDNWFIVQAELPTGQISNHYEMKDWDLFDIPIKDKANTYDGHSPQDVAKRLREFLTPKPKYPKTYEECCEVLALTKAYQSVSGYRTELLEQFQELLICRDAYWKIAGEEMGLGKSWEPNWSDDLSKYYISFYNNKVDKSIISYSNKILVFPTEEMRDAFKENFDKDIDACRELL